MLLLILLALPWLDRSKVKSIRYRSWPYKVALGVFVVSFITLGWLGMEPVTKTNSILAQVYKVGVFQKVTVHRWCKKYHS
jgi:ubiquinol-cytochrome c reductase cytochrome b subunit